MGDVGTSGRGRLLSLGSGSVLPRSASEWRRMTCRAQLPNQGPTNWTQLPRDKQASASFY